MISIAKGFDSEKVTQQKRREDDMEIIDSSEFLFIIIMTWMAFLIKLTCFSFKKEVFNIGEDTIFETKVSYQMLVQVEGDEDMKILSDSSYKSCTVPDTNEDEISQYFWHKRNGNIDVAKYLGERLSSVVLEYKIREHLDLWTNLPSDIPVAILEEQAQMMYVYVAETMAKENSPDSIICQMIISSLNDGISDRIPNFYSKMADCRAYTLYKLCGSRKDKSNCVHYIGETYAQMLGLKDNESLCKIGELLYNSVQRKCLDIFSSINYVTYK